MDLSFFFSPLCLRHFFCCLLYPTFLLLLLCWFMSTGDVVFPPSSTPFRHLLNNKSVRFTHFFSLSTSPSRIVNDAFASLYVRGSIGTPVRFRAFKHACSAMPLLSLFFNRQHRSFTTLAHLLLVYSFTSSRSVYYYYR